jgi:DHA2 family multidrug resistance protein-like MFS transporter
MSDDKTAAKPPAAADGLPWQRRRWAVAAVFTAVAMASLDTAIASTVGRDPHVRLRGAGLAFVSLPFYFEDVMGHSQVETGFFMTPWPLVVVIMAPIGGRLSDRFSAGQLGGLGLVLFGIGMVLLATLPTSPGIVNIVRRVVICGIGFGFFQTLNMRAIMSSAPPHRSGGASGIVVTARLIGQTTGAALAALRFSLAGRDGAALALGDGFAGLGSVLSFLRLTVAPRRDV